MRMMFCNMPFLARFGRCLGGKKHCISTYFTLPQSQLQRAKGDGAHNVRKPLPIVSIAAQLSFAVVLFFMLCFVINIFR